MSIPDPSRSTVERNGQAAFDHTLHGGTGRTTIQYHFADRMTLPVAVQTWILEPGASEGLHTHDRAEDELEEFYLIVSGRAVMQVDGEISTLGPGDSMLCPPGAERGVSNPGPDNLRLVVVWGRPGSADFTGFATYRKGMTARTTN